MTDGGKLAKSEPEVAASILVSKTCIQVPEPPGRWRRPGGRIHLIQIIGRAAPEPTLTHTHAHTHTHTHTRTDTPGTCADLSELIGRLKLMSGG